MKPIHRFFLTIFLGGLASAGLSSCTSTDPSTDTMVYPTPAEKNQQMQENLSQMTRSFL